MSSFSVETLDSKGREGTLEIESISIPTPNYIPTRNEFFNLQHSEYVERKNYSDVDIGVHVQWLDAEKIHEIKSGGDAFNKYKSYVQGRLKVLDVPLKMVHFDFDKTVTDLDATTLKLLLTLQAQIGTNIIEIPNLGRKGWNYRMAVEKAAEWRSGKEIDAPLMGIACEPTDVYTLKSQLGQVDCIGVNLRRNNFPLLYAIEEELKPLDDVWVHGFGTPRSYRQVRGAGTLGVLVNSFGVDTVSSQVAHPGTSRRFAIQRENMTEREVLESAPGTKYFSAQDYSTTRYESMIAEHGSGFSLSHLCSCPVCGRNTLKSIVSKADTTYQNTISHEVLSHLKEAKAFKRKIVNNESSEYLASKAFAQALANRRNGD
ncbi:MULTISPECIES: hypothetical protein [Methanoculleus]|jgi:hypothetical protein|uniref:hypothetical protein n=1 Tax=Methanoculleus TaxID=45989 RepID=UPI00257D399B|nr:hypothetical protein [Methanoculleus sp. UBA413]